jgi:hypothetical protein
MFLSSFLVSGYQHGSISTQTKAVNHYWHQSALGQMDLQDDMARGERYPVLTVQRHVRLLSSDCLTFPPIPACPAGLFCFCCRNLCLNNVCTEILPDQICIVSQQSTCTQPISIFDHIDVIVDLKHGVGWLLKVSKWRLEIFDRCLRLVLFQKSVG